VSDAVAVVACPAAIGREAKCAIDYFLWRSVRGRA
jgi:hypothetical protein